ncbi:hypothetical protein D3C80_1756440 [compost metagenome]
MPRKSKHINIHLLHIDIQRSGTLCCINQKNSLMLLGDFSDLTNRENTPQQVRAMVADDHPGIRSK